MEIDCSGDEEDRCRRADAEAFFFVSYSALDQEETAHKKMRSSVLLDTASTLGGSGFTSERVLLVANQ
jgi:hypothetical protein